MHSFPDNRALNPTSWLIAYIFQKDVLAQKLLSLESVTEMARLNHRPEVPSEPPRLF